MVAVLLIPLVLVLYRRRQEQQRQAAAAASKARDAAALRPEQPQQHTIEFASDDPDEDDGTVKNISTMAWGTIPLEDTNDDMNNTEQHPQNEENEGELMVDDATWAMFGGGAAVPEPESLL